MLHPKLTCETGAELSTVAAPLFLNLLYSHLPQQLAQPLKLIIQTANLKFERTNLLFIKIQIIRIHYIKPFLLKPKSNSLFF